MLVIKFLNNKNIIINLNTCRKIKFYKNKFDIFLKSCVKKKKTIFCFSFYFHDHYNTDN